MTVAPGVLQIEAGYQFTEDTVDLQTFPNALLRFGLEARWELQVGWSGWSRADGQQDVARGASDMSIGFKHTITQAASATPVALFAGATVPTGNQAFSSGSVYPVLGVFWSHASSLDWFGAALVTESGGDVTVANAVGISFPVGPRSGGFVEYVAQFPEGTGPSHVLNGGVAFTPHPDFQWDLNAGVGLNSRALDVTLGAGLAYCF